ncbi:tetratricopeptide repeat protein [Rhodosalinus sp. K401]|uniref:tetratricopeptide repeat-containing sulfotransferase family protein n=1 Tax=Rhodosalinus sp. K401 TaxID=3239195 RepID=UPI0035238C8B
MPPPTPQQIKAAFAKAGALHAKGRLAEARRLYADLTRAAPRAPEPHYHLARIALAERDLDAAAKHLKTAGRLKPGEPALLALQAQIEEAAGRPEAALKTYDRLIAARPKAPKPRADKALLLQQMGDFDAAEAEFMTAIRHNPAQGELYRMVGATRKLAPGDPLIAEMEQVYARDDLTDGARCQLAFALAKVMEDTKRHDRVFGYLDTANALQRRAFPFDFDERAVEIDRLHAAMDDLSKVPAAAEDFRPVFVIGLPRSGTTLVEQIVAAHSTVEAGGELGLALDEFYRRFQAGRAFTPVSKAHPRTHLDFAAAYEARVRAEVRFDARVTDKSIQTFQLVGYLARVLPGARFVAVRRDPRDVALSIYKNHFQGGTHRYSNDLRDIARYMRLYGRILEAWKARLPGVIHEVGYEDLVSDPEPQARALVAAAGLDWEPGCLDFHKAAGSVKTLSLHQVRQPIYKSSAEAWRRYEAELAPFLEEWERTA